MQQFQNKLIHETSPYLLQHAHNPVEWYPWGDEALQKARAENKPILVSIGYAACHWCHVMERESFEDIETASFMNEHFVNIKIDREERPDLDHIYMDAVQAMTGSGGWPLNVFLTPDAKPFYGGTYFPPVRAFNRSSWKETLAAITQAFRERRDEIDQQAVNLTEHLINSNSFGLQKGLASEVLSKQKLDETYDNVMKMADREWGGFGKAPKFPQTFTIQFLLRYAHFTKNEAALKQALLSIDKMVDGGIYDQVGGGFARYSTDEEWLVPHFEKMLYDNALLVTVISEAYQLTGNARYKDIIEETIAFIEREMMHPLSGFYSALDADSEGEEGKFYVWTKGEVMNILGEQAELFCKFYDISERGNWTSEHTFQNGTNIPRVLKSYDVFAQEHNLTVDSLKDILKKGRLRLLEDRSRRVRPQLDDKIILGWNALMNSACSRAYAATGRDEYLKLAVQNMRFLMDKFKANGNTEFFHTWKNDTAKFPAFLDDYAYLLLALLDLQEVTGDTTWLLKAKDIMGWVLENFSEEETGYFFYTRKGQEDVIIRKKEIYDAAVPSGNAVMAEVLYKLGVLFDLADWHERAISLISSLLQVTTRYPTSFGRWNSFRTELAAGIVEVAITGKEPAKVHRQVLKQFIPNKVLMATREAYQTFPLLAEKPVKSEPLIFVCKEFSCLEPTHSVERAIDLINGSNTLN